MRFLYIVFFLLLGGLCAPAQAQTFILDAPKVVQADGTTRTRVLFKPDDQVRLNWSKPLTGGALKIGTSPGNYNLTSTAVSGVEATITPSGLGLSTGVYYGILTTAAENTLSGIQQAHAADASVDYSPEFPIVVESPTAPAIISPRGSIDNATPTFEWEAVPGVPAYVVLLSSTPFAITRDENDEIVVEGANIIWQLMTTETSAVYGETNPDSPLPDFGAPPPLLSGNVYNYSVLNMYSETEAAFLSDVFGTVVEFTYAADQSLDAPVLVAPADGEEVFGAETIALDWDPVAGANSYSVFLFERVRDGQTVIDLPIWSTTTTSTVVDFQARASLKRGEYVWYVVPSDDAGAGSASPARTFNYVVEMGEFRYTTHSADDGTELVGVTVQVRSLDGGYTPNTPFVATTKSSLVDSLVAGRYAFEASKAQHADTTVTVEIFDGQRTNIALALTPLPSRITGRVEDDAGQPVDRATVSFVNTATGGSQDATTSTDGSFSADLQAGTYDVSADKAGYLADLPISVSVEIDQQLDLSVPLVLVNDAISVTGRVLNQAGEAIQLANVTATLGGVTHQEVTNSAGDYAFTLSSGTWTLGAEKDGFVGAAPLTLALSAGDNFQNQNLTLQEHANQISGTVYEVVTQSGGQTDLATYVGATITATPSAGTPVTTASGSNGSYTLNLTEGTYTVQATADGFGPSASVEVVVGIGQTVDGVAFELTPHASTVSGLVMLTDGSELEGVLVEVAGLTEDVTSTSGAYTLSLPPGTHEVRVFRSGYVAPAPRTITVAAADELSGINFEMLPDAGVLGGSVTSAGQAVVGATVTAVSGSETVAGTTGSTGSYTLSVPAGTWTLSAAKDGFQTATGQGITVGAGQESLQNDFDLNASTAAIEGSVTDGAAAVRSADVLVTRLDGSDAQATVTRADGGFSISVTPGYAYQVVVSKTGYRTTSALTSLLAEGDEATLAMTLAASSAAVSGAVVDAALVGLAGATVEAYQGSTVVEQTTAGIDGSYTLSLDAGTYDLRASAPGYATAEEILTLSVGQVLSDFDITLEDNFATVRGAITDAGGAGVANALVSLSSTNGGGSVRTGTDGAYIIPSLVAGTYTASVEADGFADASSDGVIVTGGQTKVYNVTLTSLNGRIIGEVLDVTGQPVSGVTLYADDEAGNRFSTLSSTDGSYEVAPLPLGTYTVSAVKAGFSSTAAMPAVLTAGAKAAASGPTAVIVIDDLLANDAGLSGVVRDALTDAPLLDVVVALAGDAGSGSGQTNTDGSYRIEGLAPGTYTVTTTKAGYSGVAQAVTISAAQTLALDLEMAADNGRITGRATDESGGALPFVFTVKASSGTLTYTATTDAAGNFTLEGLATGRTYTVRTDIFREGYVNATASVTMALGAGSADAGTLRVPVHTAAITGTAGTGAVTVQVIDTAAGEVVQVAETSTDGSYNAALLPAGTYRVIPSKAGFTFSPAERTVTVGVGAQATADFSANANVGTIAVTITQGTAPAAGVTVSAASTDNTVVKSSVTGSGGVATFSSLTGGKTYVIQPAKDGFVGNPVTREVVLAKGAVEAISFTMTPSTASISGTVREPSGTVVGPAQLAARRLSTGNVFRATAQQGAYTIESLPAGTYQVIASLSGFLSDTLSVTLVDGQAAAGQDFTLAPLNVRVIGDVLFAGQGVAGVTVTATASAKQTVTTNASGRFVFPALPISATAADTTTYEIRISGNGISTRTRILDVRGDAAGKTLAVNDFILPSGQLRLAFTNGVAPLPGVAITLDKPNGERKTATTGTAGLFTSVNTLELGTYRVTATKSGYLRASAAALRFELDTDTTQVAQTIPLPYQHTVPTQVAAGADAAMQVRFPRGLAPGSSTQARLFYKRASQQRYTEAAMTRQDTLFVGILPAQFALENISYYIEVDDALRGILYTTPTNTITPTAEGILTTVRLNPALHGLTVRAGETYTLRLTLRDGIGQSMLDAFVGGSGRLTWATSDPSLTIDYPEPGDSTVVTLTGQAAGTFAVTTTARLGASTATARADVQVNDVPVGAVAVAAPVTRLSNQSAGVQLTYSVEDTSGTAILLGNSLAWQVSPPAAARIDEQGFLIPEDPTFIGPLTVTATDAVSGLSADVQVALFARIDAQQGYTLTDGSGMALTLPAGAVPFAAEIGLADARLVTPKKHVRAGADQRSYTVGDQVLRFTFRSDRALPGDSLAVGASLMLPMDASLRFHEGDKAIAQYDMNGIAWHLMPSQASGDALTAGTFRRFGEYAVLAENEALGLRQLSVLPSPFSPDVAPVKIGYVLATAAPPAEVSIRIFNLRGELVRVLLDGAMQQSGRFGSRTSPLEITWDGLTDSGHLARNGRYIIQVTARDASGQVTEMIPVVLIK